MVLQGKIMLRICRYFPRSEKDEVSDKVLGIPAILVLRERVLGVGFHAEMRWKIVGMVGVESAK